MEFAVLTDHRKNLKESEKKDKYLDLARELKKKKQKKTRNMKEQWNQLWLVLLVQKLKD